MIIFGRIKVFFVGIFYLIVGIFYGAGFDSVAIYKNTIKNIPEYSNTLKTAVPQTQFKSYIENFFNSEIAEGKKTKKAIVIGYDGCRADMLKFLSEAHESGINAVLAEEGSQAFITYSGGKNYPDENTQRTSTASGWCSMLTGVWADKHGVTDSDIVKSDEYPTVLMSLVENKTINSSAFYVSWNGHFAYDYSTYAAEKKYCENNGINAAYVDADSDEETKQNVLNDLKKADCSDFIFSIFEDPDDSGHGNAFSPNNSIYKQGFFNAEKIGFDIVNAVKSRETYDSEDWLIIITTDHGGSAFGHGSMPINERMTFVVSNKKLENYFGGNPEDGNDMRYSVQLTEEKKNSPLKNKKIIFLGSSVTYGSKSEGESFVDFLEKADGISAVKEAVPGTTLVDNGEQSYISRMKKIDKNIKADAFVCQLSTNDASKNLPLGKISESFDIKDFDTSTVAGAIEYIISYAKETWSCPIMFYTGTKYDSEQYGKMVDLLNSIAEKHNISVLDMWNDEDLNNISAEDYDFYMSDGVHPRRAGYKFWWLPEFEKAIDDIIK